MSDTTGTPTGQQVAAALRILADRAAADTIKPADPHDRIGGRLYVSFHAHQQDDQQAMLAAMTDIAPRAQLTNGSRSYGPLYAWRGRLAGWPISVSGYEPEQPEPAAAEQPADPTPAEAGPTDCTCWATSPNGCPVHRRPDADDDEHQDDDAGPLVTSADRIAAAWLAAVPVDTSPAVAAAEQPAGQVDTWPAVVPAQRPPAGLLPSPSWARVGAETAFAPLVDPRPLTDPALSGRPTPSGPGGLVTLGELVGDPDRLAPISPGTHIAPAASIVTLSEVRARRTEVA